MKCSRAAIACVLEIKLKIHGPSAGKSAEMQQNALAKCL